MIKPMPGAGIATRRRCKHAPVFTRELGYALIPDREGGRGDGDRLRHEQTSCFVEPKGFLILEWRHACGGPELPMKSRRAHAGHLGDLFDAERFLITLPDPFDRFAHASDGAGSGYEPSQRRALRTLQKPIHEFALQKRGHDRRIFRSVEQE